MKKYLLMLIIVLTFIMCGCQTNGDTNTIDQQNNNQTNATATTNKSEITENISIIIRNLDQIDDIKAILNEEDELKATEALLNLQGTGLKSKDDLVRFLEVIIGLPTLDLIDGEVSTISYMKGLAEDTGEEYEFAYISIKASDGDWVRFEYLLGEEESLTTNGTISLTDQGIIVFSNPVQSAEGRVKVFSEQSKNHSSGVGKLFTWDTNIDGMNTKIIYYAKNQDQINTASAFSGVSILKLYEEDESK